MLPLSENALDEMVARERERGAPPLTDWTSLSARLRTEGLMESASPSSGIMSRRWMQLAAGLVLAVGGAAVGRMTAGTTAGAASSQSASAGNSQTGITPVSAQQDPATSEQSAATLASAGQPFASPEQAWAVLNSSGAEYQRASAYLSSVGSGSPTPAEPAQYRTRLAALDNVMNDMRGALKEAPHDPVINQYYRAAVGVREATLRQLGTTLPAGARLNRY